MKTKTLAQVDGIIGIIAGAVLAILPVVIVMIAAISDNEDFAGFVLGVVFLVFTLVKIATLILGILTLVYYKDDKRISLAPSILGWIGGIILIIGGALYLSSLKHFQIEG